MRRVAKVDANLVETSIEELLGPIGPEPIHMGRAGAGVAYCGRSLNPANDAPLGSLGGPRCKACVVIATRLGWWPLR